MGFSSYRERCDCPHARVREENVDATMFLFHDGIEPVQIFQPRDVAHDRRHVSLDEGCGLLQLFLSSPGDHDVRTFFHEALRCGQANPDASARDDCNLTFECFHDSSLSLCVFKPGQICARPPSTATSLPVMKLLSD